MSSMTDRFEHPVTVLVGLGFPRQVEDASEASALLQDLAATYRGPAYEAALQACKLAMAGQTDAVTARGVLEEFARSKGILLSGPVAVAAMAAKHDLLRA